MTPKQRKPTKLEMKKPRAKAKREAPKVEATTPNLPVWAWKVKGGTELWHIGFGPAPSSGVDSVEYVKADPLADAVVAAARLVMTELAKNGRPMTTGEMALRVAFDALWRRK